MSSPLANYFVGSATLSHTYSGAYANATASEPWLAFFTGGDRDGRLENNPGGRFRLETTVVADGVAIAPAMTLAPLVPIPRVSGEDVVYVAIANFDTTDVDDGAPAVRLAASGATDATAAEWGGVFDYEGRTTFSMSTANVPSGPAGFTVTNKGVASWDVSEATAGLYHVVIMAESASDSAIKVPIDFTVYLYDQVSFCDKDCQLNVDGGLATFADPDGIYGADGGHTW